MAQSPGTIEVYLEIGKKRTFAGAIDWPGWCRMGHDQVSALGALCDAGPRYARVLQAAGIALQPPADPAMFAVVERLAGNTSTDFGAPNSALSSDTQPVDAAELRRFQTLLKAYWQAFDSAVQAATGKPLRKGPRGGGRDLAAIAAHVLGAEAGYLARLAWKHKQDARASPSAEAGRTHQAVLDALAAATAGGLPERGPRGGAIWTPRTFVRRVAWHVLDHLWEIEARAQTAEREETRHQTT